MPATIWAWWRATLTQLYSASLIPTCSSGSTCDWTTFAATWAPKPTLSYSTTITCWRVSSWNRGSPALYPRSASHPKALTSTARSRTTCSAAVSAVVTGSIRMHWPFRSATSLANRWAIFLGRPTHLRWMSCIFTRLIDEMSKLTFWIKWRDTFTKHR